jgi:hypothetical protein
MSAKVGSGRVRKSNLRWEPIIAEAREIVESYNTAVTLRQLFYRLVARQLIPNTLLKYKYLSELTAMGRRDGTFPDLTDRTSEIHGGAGGDTSPADALRSAAKYYTRDHSEGQPWSVYLGVEKAGMVNQLESWFGEYSVAILALGGYASQSYADEVVRDVRAQKRPAVLFYAGDHDPTGWDIDRDFVERTDCWEQTHRLALDPELIARQQLPEAVDPETLTKLEKDSRAKAFVERFGSLTQVELDALPPEVLRDLFQQAIFGDAITPGGFWDMSGYEAALAREADERQQMLDFIEGWQ